MPSHSHRLFSAMLVAVACAACGANTAPEMSAMGDQQALVGAELVLTLRATDAEGDPLHFTFASDNSGIDLRATLTDGASGTGMFRWTPFSADIGLHVFDFSVTDGSSTTVQTIAITVAESSSVGRPAFVKPLGSGTTANLSQQACIAVEILVDDPDSTNVTLALGEPAITGGALEQAGPMSGVWSWCPTAKQVTDSSRYALRLIADDGDNPPVSKEFLLLLQCDGAAPVVVHTPVDVTTAENIKIHATVSAADDAPVLYYSQTEPIDPPNLLAMESVVFKAVAGQSLGTEWEASVPNPVAGESGKTATLYYVIVAKNGGSNSCTHTAQAPDSGSYTMTITSPGGCTDDSHEDDDGAASARAANLNNGKYQTTGNAICTLDEDWFAVPMIKGETLHASLGFLQTAATEDLDLVIYKNGNNLTQCSEQTPTLCDPNNGQSPTGDEKMSWPITETATYFVVVRGWDGAQNNHYSLCIGRSAATCP